MPQLFFPAQVVYGKNSLKQVGESAKNFGKRALIVSDPIMKELGNVEACIELLDEAGIDSYIYTDIKTEPVTTYVNEALELCKTHECNMIISIGGGSCIDTAKAVAVLYTNGGHIREYVNRRKVAKKSMLPLIAIPTTGGTGSEVTDATVITDAYDDTKMMIKQPAFMPTVAIVDPILTLSSPPNITKAVGLDALTHALEAYISKDAHLFSDQLAKFSFSTIIHNLEKVCEDGSNEEAREEVMVAAMQAGMAFTNASLCLVHGMSRPVGALYHIPHGISNAMLLPVVLEYNQSECYKQLYELGTFTYPELKEDEEYEGAKILVERIINLCGRLNIDNFQSWGIDKESFLANSNKMASDALESGSPYNNPKIATKQEIIELYSRAFDYRYGGD